MANIWKTNVDISGDSEAVTALMNKLRKEETWHDCGIDNPITDLKFPGVEFHGTSLAAYTRHAPDRLLEQLEQLSALAPKIVMQLGFYDLSCAIDEPYVPNFTGTLIAGVWSNQVQGPCFNLSMIAGLDRQFIEAHPVLVEYVRDNAEELAVIKAKSAGERSTAVEKSADVKPTNKRMLDRWEIANSYGTRLPDGRVELNLKAFKKQQPAEHAEWMSIVKQVCHEIHEDRRDSEPFLTRNGVVKEILGLIQEGWVVPTLTKPYTLLHYDD